MTSVKDAAWQSFQGVFLRVHVTPGSSRTMFPTGYNPWRNSIEIKVQSSAKENKANSEVVETIAGFFGLASKNVVISSGLKNREKTVILKQIAFETVLQKLERSLHG